MGRKAAKATRKLAKSGALKRTIDARRKHQKVRKGIERRKGGKRNAQSAPSDDPNSDFTDQEDVKPKTRSRRAAVDFIGEDGESGEELDQSVHPSGDKFGKMSIDDLLGGDFMNDDEDDEESSDEEEGDDDSIDDLEDEETVHKLDLAVLKEKDPEFYKYLQENDPELLNFSAKPPPPPKDDGGFDLVGDQNDEEASAGLPVLTLDVLRGWQTAILETRSLGALRKLHDAFCSAVSMNDESNRATQSPSWNIEDSDVFNKLIVTTLKFTPVVFEHHAPTKVTRGGKIKPPKRSPTLRKLSRPYLQSIVHLVQQLSDAEMQQLAIQESSKLLPHSFTSRKVVRAYLKMCLELWATAAMNVRLASLFALRKLASAGNESILNDVLRGTYTAFIHASKTRLTAHNLPSVNLMKNSASELYFEHPSEAYQLAFGYIRQLAILLRNNMKLKSKEYRGVYNWQFVHCVDFWATVFAKSCNPEAEGARRESALRPLIYPLVQVALGAVELVSGLRHYPFHLQILHSMLHLTRYTRTHIPIFSFIVPIITSSLSDKVSKAKSNLRPLSLPLHIRCPEQYSRTLVYTESLCDEAVFVLGGFCESLQNSVAFPEITVPLILTLRKALKGARNRGKCVAMVKALIERIEDGGRWVNAKRSSVTFAPSNTDDVDKWERSIEIEKTPVGKWMRIQRKARDKQAALAQKAREGKDHILDDDDDDDDDEEAE